MCCVRVHAYMQMYEAAHKMVKLVIKKNLTNERDNCDQVLFRLLLKEGYADLVNGRPISWVSVRTYTLFCDECVLTYMGCVHAHASVHSCAVVSTRIFDMHAHMHAYMRDEHACSISGPISPERLPLGCA
jgi:hypothetical protein